MTVIDAAAAVRQAQDVIDQLINAVQFVFLFALAAGLLVLYSALVATEDERRREAAVMRVYGASRAQVTGTQRAEFLAMGVIAGCSPRSARRRSARCSRAACSSSICRRRPRSGSPARPPVLRSSRSTPGSPRAKCCAPRPRSRCGILFKCAMEFAAYLLVGLAIGALAAWLSNRETRRQLAEVSRSRETTLEQLREESSRRASFEALAAGIPELQKEIEARSLTIAQQGRTILEVTTEKEALAATLEAERKAIRREAEAARGGEDRAVGCVQRALGERAAKQLRGVPQARAASVAPIKEALGKFDSKIQALEVAREGAYQGLLQQVSQLLDTGRQPRSETSSLAQALRSPVVAASGARSSCGAWSRWPEC